MTITALDRYRRLPTETAMVEAIAKAVHHRGGRVWHIRDSRLVPETKDLPDLIILLPPYVMVLELKSQTRRFEPGQVEVAELLRRCDRLVAGVVRPEPKPGELSYDSIVALIERVER